MKNIKGLTSEQAKKSEQENGRNILTPKERRGFLKTYWDNYDDPIIIVLLIALGINVIFTFFGKVDWHECAGILLSVIISTFVSTISEYSNENTYQKLQEEAEQVKCKVYRDDRLREILISEIVVGDTVLLQAGDMVPADGRISYGQIMVDQSSLSGESREVEKSAEANAPKKADFNNFGSNSYLLRGSYVRSGEATMVVDVVGDKTVYGRLTSEAQNEGRESPLTVKLRKLAKSISRFGCISAVLIVLICFFNDAFLANNFDPELISAYFADTAQVTSDIVGSLIIGVIVIVVAVPDGLPLMIAIVCSLNMKKMLKSNVLVRKLIGIETAGGINILFTDKTGTISKGRLKVVRFIDCLGRESESFKSIDNAMKKLIVPAVTANSSAKISGGRIIGGNTTEKALIEFVGAKGEDLKNISVIKKVPFSSAKKYSIATIDDGKVVTFVKGAPEKILPQCRFGYAQGEKREVGSLHLEKKIKELAKDAMRLIALAVKDGACEGEEIPDKLTLIGIVAIRDEIRPEAKSAIEEMHRAGVQVVMITGDRCDTAEAIGRETSLVGDGDIVMTSDDMSQMSDEELKKILPKLRVVARALPDDKSRLVRIAQEMNLVTAMTGDGVNDVPALKLADVGFAMGSGTEAASAASDIVIMDDNFRSVRNAVLYGRTIYKSIKKFVQFQLTINVAAVIISMLGPIVGVEKPLDISQMIWTNLLIDSLAAIAFGGEPALKKYMLEKPRCRDEDIIDNKMWGSVITNSLYICGLSLLYFIAPAIRDVFRSGAGDVYFYTGYFAFFIFISIFNAFNARCDGIDLFENLSLNKQFIAVMAGVASVQISMIYFGGNLLRTAGLNLGEWIVVMLLAVTIIPVDIIRKLISKKV